MKKKHLLHLLREEEHLRHKMSDILHRTAVALHGSVYPHGHWSWHDLPELADELRKRAEKKGKRK